MPISNKPLSSDLRLQSNHAMHRGKAGRSISWWEYMFDSSSPGSSRTHTWNIRYTNINENL